MKLSAAVLCVLRLSGSVHDATRIADFLRSLRSRVRAPLYAHFNTVVTSGIGFSSL